MYLKILLSFVCLASIALLKEASCDTPFDPVHYVTEMGYSIEPHVVNSKSGYPVEIFRIVSPDNFLNVKRPVFLQPGILASSDFYLLNHNDSVLPYMLADRGYDVWLGNFRGNKYGFFPPYQSKAPDYLKKFWNFTWHDLALEDLSSQLDYVYENCNGEQITFIGHSVGTTMFLVLLAEKPEYNDKIFKSFLMSPMAYMSHANSLPLVAFRDLFNDYKKFLERFGYRTSILSKEFRKVLEPYCSRHFDGVYCDLPSWVVVNDLGIYFTEKAREVVERQFTLDFSVKLFDHYGQLFNSPGYFRQFDYGTNGNQEVYGNSTPPSYNLSNVKVPVYTIVGSRDNWSKEVDVQKLEGQLNNLEKTPWLRTDFGDLEFLLSKEAKKEVYEKIIEALNVVPLK